MLVLWGTRSGQGSGYDLLRVWRDHASDVRGRGIDKPVLEILARRPGGYNYPGS